LVKVFEKVGKLNKQFTDFAYFHIEKDFADDKNNCHVKLRVLT